MTPFNNGAGGVGGGAVGGPGMNMMPGNGGRPMLNPDGSMMNPQQQQEWRQMMMSQQQSMNFASGGGGGGVAGNGQIRASFVQNHMGRFGLDGID